MALFFGNKDVLGRRYTLYTFITNKNGRGKRGSLVASVKGTLSANIIQVLEKIPLEQRNKVKEVTLDMAKNMESSARTCFPMANLVTDRFHVVRLALEALQHIRVNQRWVELDMENKAIEAAKKNGVRYKAPLLPNGDTPKQLLARCRYVFAKKKADWTQSQEQRANIAFENYPDLKKAYDHVLEFRLIYESNTKISAEKKFNEWINKTHEMEIKEFLTVANTVSNHMSNILNFFDNRSTNANAESFNSKIKLFRANLRGVVDTRFFLFRLSKLFA
ncbi:transposase [Cytophagaceae bacterium ABcell3]|nr:transposase [Cytophagaceae bacterium ABcell3]